MAGVMEIIGGVLIAVGAFFFVVGAVGVYRMPDVFTRMHAASVSDTVGAGLLLVGMMFFAGFSLVTLKLAIILGVVLLTSPIATHAVAQAALHEGLEPMLADGKTLIGPGAHEPEPTKSVAKKSKGRAARRKPAKRSARTARAAASRKKRVPS